MELNEKDLENVFAGIDREGALELSKENASIYRKKAIENLTELKENILNSREKELTEEELENVRGGIRR